MNLQIFILKMKINDKNLYFLDGVPSVVGVKSRRAGVVTPYIFIFLSFAINLIYTEEKIL